MNKHELSKRIKEKALKLGFDKVGIAEARVLSKSEFLNEWLAKGFHGDMTWMEHCLEKRLDVHKLFSEARSVIVVAHNYYTPHNHSDGSDVAKISRYAWGRDYHKIIKKRLKRLLGEVKQYDSSVDGRLFVDTAPIQDKLWAEAAGIGWQGKNTNILTRELGSWIFLGELVLNIELDYDTPVTDHCGSCTACIDACPTDALQPYILDARKCISYLTIEYRKKPIPEDLAGKMENWIFGCDICQDVCPWNKFKKVTHEPGYEPDEENIAPRLDLLAKIDPVTYKKRFGKSPVSRATHNDFLRNVCAVSGNRKTSKNK